LLNPNISPFYASCTGGNLQRAKLMGGKLTVWSAPESGTEIELSIPGVRGYAESLAPRRAWFGEMLASKSGESES